MKNQMKYMHTKPNQIFGGFNMYIGNKEDKRNERKRAFADYRNGLLNWSELVSILKSL